MADRPGTMGPSPVPAPDPGLAFLGLPFQYALASQQIQGVDRDARHLVKHLRPAARIAA